MPYVPGDPTHRPEQVHTKQPDLFNKDDGCRNNKTKMSELQFNASYTEEDYLNAVQQDFTARATRYDTGKSGESHTKLLQTMIEIYPPAYPLVDIACGTGLLSTLVSCPQLVTGIDITPAMLQQARVKSPASTFVHATASALPLPDCTFASAYICSALPYLPDLPLALREIFRVLKPGAFLAVHAVTPDSYLLGTCITESLTRVVGPRRAHQLFPNMHHPTRDESACKLLLTNSAFRDISVCSRQQRDDIHLADLPGWWTRTVCSNALFGFVSRLEADVLEDVRTQFVDIASRKAGVDGILHDVISHWFIRGWKPDAPDPA